MIVPPPQPLRLLVVIVVYRVADLTIDCLRSLMPQVMRLPGVAVAICENGSGGDVADRLRSVVLEEGWEERVWLRVISPNRGFTGGNNAILDPALAWPTPPKYFLLLNSDTIVREGAIATLIEAMDARPDVGAMGPHLVGLDGSPQVSCFRDPSPVSEFLRAARTGPLDRVLGGWLTSSPLPHHQGPYDWTSFAAAMVRSEALREVGTFDEGYFLYFDDPDLGRRIRRAGWTIGHCPEATIVHLEGAANDVPASIRARRRPPSYLYVSRARYLAKRYGLAGLWIANLAWHCGRGVSWIRERLERRASHVPTAQWRDIWTNALRPWHAPHLPHPRLDPEPTCDLRSRREDAVPTSAV